MAALLACEKTTHTDQFIRTCHWNAGSIFLAESLEYPQGPASQVNIL
jgi:hypothetical protein